MLRRILVDEDLPNPACVFLAAHEPHTKAELTGYTPEKLDDWVKDRTVRFGGVPDRLLENQSFWRIYLPLYRADYTLIGTYDFKALDLSTDIPLTVFYSETDTPLSDMRQWTRYFTGPCEFIEFGDISFFQAPGDIVVCRLPGVFCFLKVCVKRKAAYTCLSLFRFKRQAVFAHPIKKHFHGLRASVLLQVPFEVEVVQRQVRFAFGNVPIFYRFDPLGP